MVASGLIVTGVPTWGCTPHPTILCLIPHSTVSRDPQALIGVLPGSATSRSPLQSRHTHTHTHSQRHTVSPWHWPLESVWMSECRQHENQSSCTSAEQQNGKVHRCGLMHMGATKGGGPSRLGRGKQRSRYTSQLC